MACWDSSKYSPTFQNLDLAEKFGFLISVKAEALHLQAGTTAQRGGPPRALPLVQGFAGPPRDRACSLWGRLAD